MVIRLHYHCQFIYPPTVKPGKFIRDIIPTPALTVRSWLDNAGPHGEQHQLRGVFHTEFLPDARLHVLGGLVVDVQAFGL